MLLAVSLLAGGIHAALVVRSYRRLGAVLPAGYLWEQLTDPVRDRNSAAALAVAGGDNPWVTGAALSRPGQGRQPVRGRLLGVRFLLIMLLVSCFTCFLGFDILIGGFIEGS